MVGSFILSLVFPDGIAELESHQGSGDEGTGGKKETKRKAVEEVATCAPKRRSTRVGICLPLLGEERGDQCIGVFATGEVKEERATELF